LPHIYGRTPNTVAFEGKYWQIDCGYYSNSQWRSLGVVKLVFNRNYTVSVYKDGQYLYNVPVYVCTGPNCNYDPWAFRYGPWAPAQRIVILVSWRPEGVTVGVPPFRFNPHTLGYGDHLVYAHDVQTAALPYYYKYNLTGAYLYRLEVKIDTAEEEWVTQDGPYFYINTTYSGYLKLYLGDKLVAYDAFYGWTTRREQILLPPAGDSVSKPNDTCVPQKTVERKGLIHRNFKKGEDSYSVEVYERRVVHEFGCGVDRTYEEIVRADVATVTGTSYHVRDPRGNVCGFKQAQNCRRRSLLRCVSG
jgi:hypothetical protein